MGDPIQLPAAAAAAAEACGLGPGLKVVRQQELLAGSAAAKVHDAAAAQPPHVIQADLQGRWVHISMGAVDSASLLCIHTNRLVGVTGTALGCLF